ncbi:biopolymer transport protein ExbD [Inhella inkyongensis]|uniref:Biopolymer transport protein ExbD n=1 Tax=Inhella inkyongensis TaxID=392593 RepID=A0A840S335_9BURK|nr:biopolymer transporter ExbD [Inhella inkyongensis]MBB5203838.1 biopolymer transport protein ExbD [Inhella inkyongensis]
MGMNVGSSSGGDEPEVMMDVNTTPLIDVMLVLLVMLIITIPIQLHAVNLDMPVPNPNATPPQDPKVVEIFIDFDGTLFWNGEQTEKSALEGKMIEAAKDPEQPEIHIKPHKLVDYGHVAHVMAGAQRIGLKKLGMKGTEQFL